MAEEAAKTETKEDPVSEDIESSESLSFDPPVYVQRYTAVKNLLDQEKWREKISKVVDFGCSNFKLFKHLKTLKHIEHIIAVDIDADLIPKCEYEAKPMLFEYLSQFTRKLIVDLFVGSIAEPDSRLVGVDAVICIELIEHLYPETLEKVPFTVFECIQPKLAIFTTPNADFNILFKLEGFRHDDHKFEWSREEFEEWCQSILNTYDDYDVYFEGIGKGPEGTEHLGCVSQMAVFTRRESSDDPIYTNVMGEPYKLFARIEYPFKRDERTNEEIILDEIKYCISNVITKRNVYSNFQTVDGYEIPVQHIYNQIKTLCQDEQALKTKLLEFGYVVVSNENGVNVVKVEEQCRDSDLDEFVNDNSNEDCDGDDLKEPAVTDCAEEIWD